MSIVVKNVTKFYGQQKALDNISFEIKTGEIVAFLGPNGAGKSTMMKIITGFIPASSGQVFVNGEKIDADNFEIKQHIGYLPENNPLYLDMYVREYLSFVSSFYKNRPCKSVDEISRELASLRLLSIILMCSSSMRLLPDLILIKLLKSET